MKILLHIIFVVLALDFAGFAIWVSSGQMPSNNYFLGTITYHVIKLFI